MLIWLAKSFYIRTEEPILPQCCFPSSAPKIRQMTFIIKNKKKKILNIRVCYLRFCASELKKPFEFP